MTNTPRFSRRELIAWIAAGTGAAAAGGSVLLDRPDAPPSTRGATAGPAPSTTTASDSTASVRSVRSSGERKLVIVEMPGGNDGLSTLVPYGSGAYFDRRSDTVVPTADLLMVDDEVGLHPSLAGLHARGCTLVEGVGSMRPDGSHFEMQARWWAGNSTKATSDTGWVGRLADVLNDDAIPAAAVSVGSGAHPILRSVTGATLSMPNSDSLDAVAGAESDDEFRSRFQRALRSYAQPTGRALPNHGSTLAATIDFAEAVLRTGGGGESDDAIEVGYEGQLGRQLQFAAAVLAGGTGVRVMHVSMSSDFDTHEGHAWRHPQLMTELDTNLTAFHADLHRRGLGDDVLIMTTSEFGRTLVENDSGGLDHGTASTMILSGAGAGGGGGGGGVRRIGDAPSLTKLDDNNDLIATTPFESYLAGTIEGWLEVPASEVFADAEPLALFT